MSGNRDTVEVVIFFFGCAIGFCVGVGVMGLAIGNDRKDFQVEAVKAGAGEYTADENGKVLFRWKVATEAAQ